MKPATYILLLLAIVSLRAYAEEENDRRHKYGNGKNNDGAAYIGDQKTKQQLTPRMMNHYAQAQMHFAMGNIPMGTMEQTKGDMLKQQIQENKKSADKNRESEKLLYDWKEEKPNLTNGSDPKVLTVDQDRAANTKLPSEGAPPEPPPVTPSAPVSAPAPAFEKLSQPVAADQIATMGPSPRNAQAPPVSEAVVSDAAPAPVAAAVVEREKEIVSSAKPDWKRDLEGLSRTNDASQKAEPQDLPSLAAIEGRLLGTPATAETADAVKAEKEFFAKVGKEERTPASRRAKSARKFRRR